MRRLALIGCILGLTAVPAWAQFGPLEIHYINIGQGGGTLIIGPDDTTLLYDFGNVDRGKKIAEYLEHTLSIPPAAGIDYTIVSHRHSDHYGGYLDIIEAGYDVNVANFDSGSSKHPTATMRRVWLTPASKTTAGNVIRIPPGLRIPLGDGAILHVIAANGRVFQSDDTLPFARNENDRSVSLYLKYRNFDYVIDGDLGAGKAECTERDTSQRSFQLPVARVLHRHGMDVNFGIDVLHIAHHGSESSTSAAYYNELRPEVGLISVGLNQGRFLHPRVDIVERILIGSQRSPCVTAPPLKALFQTDWGRPGTSSTGATSFLGMPIGDIKLTTDGISEYRMIGSGDLENDGIACRRLDGTAWVFTIDDVATPDSGPSVNEECLSDPSTCGCALQTAEIG